MADMNRQRISTAKDVQQMFYENFGDRDWDLFKEDEHNIMKQYIGYSMFGDPEDLPSDKNETGYSSKQNQQINDIYTLLLNNNFAKDKNFYIRIIYICWNHESEPAVKQTPVIVLRKCLEFNSFKTTSEEYASKKNCKIFIDIYGRVYENWEYFLNNNKLPKCTMVCPLDGQYKGEIIENRIQVLLEYHKSPACGIKQKVLDASDIAGTTVSVLTTVGGLASLAVAAPALGIATAVGGAITATYMVGRNIYTLTDRGQHQQSIGLDNSESRWSWFSITTGVVGTAATTATGIVRSMASQGQNISKTAQIGLNVINGINMFGNTSGIFASGYNLFDKYRKDETITKLEIFQFSTSLLFFCKSVVDFQTAKSIITETQERTLQNYKESLRSNRHRKMFNKALKETERLNGKLEGRAEVISGINKIADKDMFFAGLARSNKDMNKAGARFEITSDGNIRINSAHIIDPNEFASINRGTRSEVLNNLPPRVKTVSQKDFNNSKVLVTNNKDIFKIIEFFEKILSRINIENSIDKKENIESFAYLMENFVRATIDSLLSILSMFLVKIENRAKDFFNVFPGTPISIGALQFIINYLKNLAREIKMDFEEFIRHVFDADGSVNTDFIEILVRDFHFWLDDKIRNRTSTSNQINRASTSNQINRLTKKCKICNGHYYV